MQPDHAPDLSTVGKRLRHAREKRGLSVRGLGTAAGLHTVTHVGVIENREDSGGVSAEIAIKLASALRVPVEWLVNGGEEPKWDEQEPTANGSAA